MRCWVQVSKKIEFFVRPSNLLFLNKAVLGDSFYYAVMKKGFCFAAYIYKTYPSLTYYARMHFFKFKIFNFNFPTQICTFLFGILKDFIIDSNYYKPVLICAD